MAATREKRLLDLGEMAVILHVTPRGLRHLATTGRVPHYRVGGQLRFDPDEVLEATRADPKGSV